jgi:hypothetical protein
MEKRFILRGFAAGGFSCLCAFVFARIMAEPWIHTAINFQTAYDAKSDRPTPCSSSGSTRSSTR